MNTAVINIKTDPKLKSQAQKISAELGFSLSSLMNAYLKQLVRNKTVFFSTSSEEPTEYMIEALEESELQRQTKKTSPKFSNPEDAINWLRKQS